MQVQCWQSEMLVDVNSRLEIPVLGVVYVACAQNLAPAVPLRTLSLTFSGSTALKSCDYATVLMAWDAASWCACRSTRSSSGMSRYEPVYSLRFDPAAAALPHPILASEFEHACLQFAL